VVSAVRSNSEGQVGFLADARRLNVAITRARRKLFVLGDSATLSADPHWQALIDHALQTGAHRSVFEIPGAVDL
jgi:ATP-dependent RNA/DNA helicase IGHMBP2